MLQPKSNDLQEVYWKLEKFKPKVAEALVEIEATDAASKSLLQRYINSPESTDRTSTIRIQAIIDYMYEKINIGNWDSVKLYITKTITIASYLKLLAHVKYSDEDEEALVRQAYKIIDFAILFGSPIENMPNLLQKCAALLSTVKIQKRIDIPTPTTSTCTATSKCDPSVDKFINSTPIDIVDCPSMESFCKYVLAEKPLILDNCINNWPALEKWKDHTYFFKNYGPRTVSIEIGTKYTDNEWTQKLITIEEFINQFILQKDGPTGYLAQYRLFDHIPELKNDISVPEYCCFSESDEPPDVMAWYGPKGTISPTHHDPKKNLLTQVVGEKRLLLFPPSESENLYPITHNIFKNTAQVDPLKPDLEKFPKYKYAKAYSCVLKAGQMLYIPPKWWHFVESLSTSFSVSFWWQ